MGRRYSIPETNRDPLRSFHIYRVRDTDVDERPIQSYQALTKLPIRLVKYACQSPCQPSSRRLVCVGSAQRRHQRHTQTVPNGYEAHLPPTTCAIRLVSPSSGYYIEHRLPCSCNTSGHLHRLGPPPPPIAQWPRRALVAASGCRF